MHTIIGIDCATQPNKVGLALTRSNNTYLVVEEVVVASRRHPPASIVAAWLKSSEHALLALDAPLGWPSALSSSLSQHRAGQLPAASPDQMFHRQTDAEIYRRLGTRPLEVGANLIARTAHAALKLLEDLRQLTGLEIPLAWDPYNLQGTAAIEVYPAATLAVRGTVNGPSCLDLYSSMLQMGTTHLLSSSQDARDAVLCAISGFDFLSGRCVPPSNPSIYGRLDLGSIY